MKQSILGHPLLNSNHPAQMRIPVRTFLPLPLFSTQHPLSDRPGERLLESSSVEARPRPPTSPVIAFSLISPRRL